MTTHFHQTIKRRREELGWTHAEAARRCGISMESYRDIEDYPEEIESYSLRDIEAMCQQFGMEVGQIEVIGLCSVHRDEYGAEMEEKTRMALKTMSKDAMDDKCGWAFVDDLLGHGKAAIYDWPLIQVLDVRRFLGSSQCCPDSEWDWVPAPMGHELKKASVLIQVAPERGWVFPQAGGGRPLTYWSQVRFEGDQNQATGRWTLFVALPQAPLTGQVEYRAEVWFIAPDAPIHLLVKGAKFELISSDQKTIRGLGLVLE